MDVRGNGGMLKVFQADNLRNMLLFEGPFSVRIKTRRPPTSRIFSAPNHLSNKIVLSPKIFTNTYRMELNLCQLNSVNVLLHIT